LAHIVTNNSYLSLGGTVVSTDSTSINPTQSAELQDDTCFGDTFHQRLVGLQDYQLQVELNNDYADDALDEDIEALLGTSFAVAWKPVATTISTSNPEYQFTGAISSINKTHAVGQITKISLTIMISTSAGVTRDVTP
jgi:hypothetical protein